MLQTPVELDTELRKSAYNMVDYLHSKAYQALIVSGGSAPVSRTLLAAAWRARFPEEKLPKIFVFTESENALLYKGSLDESERQEKIKLLVSKKYPELFDLSEFSLCIVDDRLDTGHKYLELKKQFQMLGFNNIDFAYFSATEHAPESSNELFISSRNQELANRLWLAGYKIEGHPSASEEVNSEITEQGSRKEGIDELRGMVGEIKRF